MDKFDEKIIGYEATKNILRQILDTLKRPELYKSKGASIPRGLLMESDPGLGKSLLATVFIKESGRKSLVFRKTSQENSFLDELRAAFLAAKEAAPSILLLEDLNLYVESNSPYAPEWACLQACIDDAKNTDIFVIATTNDTKYMPPSLLRPGRFDYTLYLEPPTGKTAEKIVSYYLRDKDLAEDVLISDIVKAMPKVSCATLKTTRVLELYQDFLSGKLINKQQAAEQYHVNVRSIQRDIDSIRDFLSEQCAKEGIVRKIEYDKKENGYRLVTQEIEQLSKGEVLALCKILLESRAFTKEQVEKQLQIILNLCVSQKEKADIEWFISNELFHYHDPAHATVDPDNLWMVAQAVRNQLVLEIEYQKLKDRQIVKRTVEPVGLMFSEYYFYLMGVITDHSTREAFHKKNDPYPTIYRLDRIHSIKETGEKFSVPYKDRFKEGEYKNRTQFMFGGEPQKISFNYYGPSVEAVLDKFPMAKVVDEKEGVCSIEAEVFGTGVKMWLLSQGSKVKVTAPETLVQEIKQEIERVDAQYEQMGGKTNG